MDAVTQQNAATAEEAVPSSEELPAQSQALLELVGTLAAQINDTKEGNLKPKNTNRLAVAELKS